MQRTVRHSHTTQQFHPNSVTVIVYDVSGNEGYLLFFNELPHCLYIQLLAQ